MDLCLTIKGFETKPIKFKNENEFEKFMGKLNNSEYTMLENMIRGKEFSPEVLHSTLLAKQEEMVEDEAKKAEVAKTLPAPAKQQQLPPSRPESRKDPKKVTLSASEENFNYVGGFSSEGKGTIEGDEKDQVMREIANGGFIGEITEKGAEKGSSTLTSLMNVKISNTDPLQIIVKSNGENFNIYDVDKIEDYPVSAQRSTGTNANPFGWKKGSTVMLARNGELKGKDLMEDTKESIIKANEAGVKFVVGDMPGVDEQFINFLQEIGADFTVYGSGDSPRISKKATKKPEPNTEKTYKVIPITALTSTITKKKTTIITVGGDKIDGFEIKIKEFKDDPNFHLFVYETKLEGKASRWDIIMNKSTRFETKQDGRKKAIELFLEKVRDPEFIKKNSKVFQGTPFMSEVESKNSKNPIKPKDALLDAVVDKSMSWEQLKHLPVYSNKGVMVMRKQNTHEHFGNPFTGSGIQGLIQMADVETAVQAYRDWLLYPERLLGYYTQHFVTDLSKALMKNPLYSLKFSENTNKGKSIKERGKFSRAESLTLLKFPSSEIDELVLFLKEKDNLSESDGILLKELSKKVDRINTLNTSFGTSNKNLEKDVAEYSTLYREVNKALIGVIERTYGFKVTEEIRPSFANSSKYTFDNTKLGDINKEQRKWILSQIEQGKLDAANLLYMKDKGEYFSHADALAEIVNAKNQEKWFNEENGEWENPLFSTEYYFKSKPATITVLNTIKERLEKLNPDISVELVSEATMNLMGFYEKRAAVYKGKVYVNVDRASTGDMVHEYAEIWLEAVQKEDPNFFAVMASMALEHPNIDHIRETISQKENLTGDRLAKEVIATLIGEYYNGNRIISKPEKTWWSKSKGYFLNLLDKIGNIVGNVLNLRGERKKIFENTDTDVILNNPLEKIIDRFADEVMHKPIKQIKASEIEGYLINSGIAQINSSVEQMNAYKKTLTELTCKI